jgi:hypothetical protein
MKQKQPRTMDGTTYSSLLAILDYLYADEEKHWMESGEPETGHIFNDITKVTKWLNAARK